MNTFTKIGNGIERFNKKAFEISSWALVVLILIMTYEVVARYVFNRPTTWSYEMSYFLSSFFIMMSMAYTLQTKNHVSIDIIYNRFSEKTKLILTLIFTVAFFFPMWALISYYMVPQVVHSFQTNERSSYGSWLPVIWPFKAWILFGLLMLLLQGLVEFIRDLHRLFKGGTNDGNAL